MRYYKYKHFKIFSAGENSPNNLGNHYQSENHDISSGFLISSSTDTGEMGI